MSRTLKTSPFWVRMADAPANAVACHDHRYGPCDLAPRSVRTFRDQDWAARCHWERTWYTAFCGCPICRGSLGLRGQRRRARHVAKAALRRRDYLLDEIEPAEPALFA